MSVRPAPTSTTATLLLAIDGSPASIQATRLIEGYKGARESLRVVLLNAQPRPLTLWPAPSLDVSLIDAALEREGERTLEPARAALIQAGFAPEISIKLDFPAEAVVTEASLHGAQAIVMGTRGHGALQGYALGSVALRVTHRSQVPIWLVRPDSRLPSALGQSLRVLLPADGSRHAERATSHLLRWLPWLGAVHVDVVHVQTPISLIESVLPPHNDIVEEWSAAAGEEATRRVRAALDSARVPHQLHVLAGEPVSCIAQLALKLESELLVMGTRGLGAAHHALIGSVALKTAHIAKVPVALVP